MTNKQFIYNDLGGYGFLCAQTLSVMHLSRAKHMEVRQCIWHIVFLVICTTDVFYMHTHITKFGSHIPHFRCIKYTSKNSQLKPWCQHQRWLLFLSSVLHTRFVWVMNICMLIYMFIKENCVFVKCIWNVYACHYIYQELKWCKND